MIFLDLKTLLAVKAVTVPRLELIQLCLQHIEALFSKRTSLASPVSVFLDRPLS